VKKETLKIKSKKQIDICLAFPPNVKREKPPVKVVHHLRHDAKGNAFDIPPLNSALYQNK